MMKCLGQSLKLKVLLFLVTMAFFASCHQHTVELACQQALNNEAVAEDSGGIFITVENFINQPHRTVAPDQLDQLTGYELILSGTSGRMDLPERQLTLSNGTVTIEDVPEGLWELTLKARAVSAGNGVSVGATILEGEAVAQVDGGVMTPVKFTLKPPENGSGTFQVHLKFTQEDGNALATIGQTASAVYELFDKKTGVQVPNSLVPRNNRNSGSGIRQHNYSIRYPWVTPATLPAGEYELRIRIERVAYSDIVWKDTVYIEPGRHTGGDVTIPRLLHLPSNPSNLRATGFSRVENGLFDATLNWTPAAHTFGVQSYEIQLRAVTASTLPTSDATWPTTGTDYFIDGVTGSPNHFLSKLNFFPVSIQDGIVELDATTNTIRLALGAGRYVCRIRAVGSGGNSPWVYSDKILQPIPEAPVVSQDFTYTVQGPHFYPTFTFNDVDFETRYRIQTVLVRRTYAPSEAEWKALLNDTAFDARWASTSEKVERTTGENSSSYNYNNGRFSNDRYLVVRVRAENDSGNSNWVYIPSLLRFPTP